MAGKASIALAVKSAFLDTNTLIQLFQFWEACSAAGLNLECVQEWEEVKLALESTGRITHFLNREDADGVRAGMNCFRSLRVGSKSYKYYSSLVCRSEMHHTILESVGLERLIAGRVPHSLRVKRPQVLYRRALTGQDYDKIRVDFDSFESELRRDHDIDIVDVENQSAGAVVEVEGIWMAAREVWSRVLIDVMDSYIYSAALESGSDVFVTSDSSLRGALQRLYSPDNEWAEVAEALNLAIGREGDVSFPQPIRPGDELP